MKIISENFRYYLWKTTDFSLGDSLIVPSSTPFLSYNVSLRFSSPAFPLGYNIISKMFIFLIQLNHRSVYALLRSCWKSAVRLKDDSFSPKVSNPVYLEQLLGKRKCSQHNRWFCSGIHENHYCIQDKHSTEIL